MNKTYLMCLNALFVTALLAALNLSGSTAILLGSIGIIGIIFTLIFFVKANKVTRANLDERELQIVNYAYKISNGIIITACKIAFIVTLFTDYNLSLKLVLSCFLAFAYLTTAFTKAIIFKIMNFRRD